MMSVVMGALVAQAALNDLEKEMVGRYTGEMQIAQDEESDDGIPMTFSYVFEFKRDKTFTIDIIMDKTEKFELDVSEAENAEEKARLANYSNTLIYHAKQTIAGRWSCTTHSITLTDAVAGKLTASVKAQIDDEISKSIIANQDLNEMLGVIFDEKVESLVGVGKKSFGVSFNDAMTFLEAMQEGGASYYLYLED